MQLLTKPYKIISVIDYTNTSRNNKKMLGYQLYIFIH